MNLILYLLGMSFGLPLYYARLGFWWVLHAGMWHFREDLEDQLEVPPPGVAGPPFRRCLKCRRRFPDFDRFSWSSKPLK
jgi:hypothetical protein